MYNIHVAASRMTRSQLGRWPSGYELARELNRLKHATEEFRFIAEVSKFVAEGARDTGLVKGDHRDSQMLMNPARFPD